MFFGNRRPRNLTARQHDDPVFQPRGEQLEAKILMAIDLGGTSPRRCRSSPRPPTASIWPDNDRRRPPGPATASPTSADLTGSGYDDLVIGAPAVTGSPPTTAASSGTGTVYVVFGSAYAAVVNEPDRDPELAQYDRRTQPGGQRPRGQSLPARNLATARPIPSAGTAINFPFTGVTFTGPASFGASVAGVTLSSGRNAIMIGAPNANGGNGAAYLISGNFAADAGHDRSTSPRRPRT